MMTVMSMLMLVLLLVDNNADAAVGCQAGLAGANFGDSDEGTDRSATTAST